MVSVVVPVYNAEPYLKECIESVLFQSYRDIELILIDDGSTDKSGAICDAYATEDDRIHVIHQINQGSSATRNKGLEISKGEWLIFIDADDWIEPDMIEKLLLYGKKEKADIVACGMIKETNEKSIPGFYPYGPIESGKHIFEVDILYSALWNKLVKKELYEISGARFVDGIKMWDDVVVTTKLRWHSSKTFILNEALYHYRWMGQSSITSLNMRKFPEDQIKVAAILAEYFESIKTENNRETIETLIDYYKIQSIMILLTPNLKLSQNWIQHENQTGIRLWRGIYPDALYNSKSIKLIPSKHNRLRIWMAKNLPYKMVEFLFVTWVRLQNR